MRAERFWGGLIGLGALAVGVGFFLPVGKMSLFDGVRKDGGVTWLLMLIPLTAALASWAGFSRKKEMALSALSVVVAVVVPVLIAALWKAGWRAQLYVGCGVVLLGCGIKGVKEVALPAGVLLLVFCGFIGWRVGFTPSDFSLGDTPLALFGFQHSLRGSLLIYLGWGFFALLCLTPVAALWLIAAGVARRTERAALISAGGLLVGQFIYLIALALYLVAAFGGTPVAMVGLGTLVLLAAGIVASPGTASPA